MARTHYKSSISISFEFVFYLTYAYDDSGNILSKKRYAYTTGDLSGLTPVETINYTYGNDNWGDLLTAYNGKPITYDAIGNPLTYDGWTYTWKDGRRLATASDGTNSLSYKYNADGIRTQKTVNGTTTEFFLNGNQIIAQKTGDDIMWFYYDHDGKRIALEYQGAMYYYIYNLQGDVEAIVNSSGTICGSYEYNDWGKITSISNIGSNTVATANPFRYRGYYYDTETELYYLNSRYYNPEWGRFMNEDNLISGSGTSVKGYNLFSYCFNNPVNMDDSNGDWPKWAKNAWNAFTNWIGDTFGTQTQSSYSHEVYAEEYNFIVFNVKSGCSQTNTTYVGEGKPVTAYYNTTNQSVGVSASYKNISADRSFSTGSASSSLSCTAGETSYSIGSEESLTTLSYTYSTSISTGDNLTTEYYYTVEINKINTAIAVVVGVYGGPVVEAFGYFIAQNADKIPSLA